MGSGFFVCGEYSLFGRCRGLDEDVQRCLDVFADLTKTFRVGWTSSRFSRRRSAMFGCCRGFDEDVQRCLDVVANFTKTFNNIFYVLYQE